MAVKALSFLFIWSASMKPHRPIEDYLDLSRTFSQFNQILLLLFFFFSVIEKDHLGEWSPENCCEEL